MFRGSFPAQERWPEGYPRPHADAGLAASTRGGTPECKPNDRFGPRFIEEFVNPKTPDYSGRQLCVRAGRVDKAWILPFPLPAMNCVRLLMVLAGLWPGLLAGEFLWIEGEEAREHTMRRHGWYDSVKKNELSGREWLSHFGQGEAPVAEYSFEASRAADHEFWVRANPVGSAMSYRLNGGAWRAISFERVEQQVNIASDGKPDLRFVAWVKVGSVSLKKGENRVSVRFESGNNRHGGLDCLVFSGEPFLPQGSRKPGEKTGLVDPGTWAFEPDRDRFSPESLLDLRALNEKPAGRRGYVARSADGEDFVDGTGRPIRFWAVNTGVQSAGDLDKLAEHAKWLAKRGVNMVRHHGHLAPGRGSKLTDVNRGEIDRIWKLVAAMQKEGIYVTVSPYWASHTRHEASWDLEPSGSGNLTGLIFFDRTSYRRPTRDGCGPSSPR